MYKAAPLESGVKNNTLTIFTGWMTKTSEMLLEESSPCWVGEQLSAFAPGKSGLRSRFGSTFDHHPAVFRCQDSPHRVMFKRGSTGCRETVWIIHHKLLASIQPRCNTIPLLCINHVAFWHIIRCVLHQIEGVHFEKHSKFSHPTLVWLNESWQCTSNVLMSLN